jgi:aldose 1-epimerase
MTYRLADGVLEVETTVTNFSKEAMPLVVGFHPYYRIPDVPRDEWMAHLPARQAVVTDARLIPTGEYKPMDLPDPLPLKGRTLDNGYRDLVRNSEGRAVFSIEARGKKVEALFGRNYPAAVVWEPAGREFICFEPMAGITNAVNLNRAGVSGFGRAGCSSCWPALLANRLTFAGNPSAMGRRVFRRSGRHATGENHDRVFVVAIRLPNDLH